MPRETPFPGAFISLGNLPLRGMGALRQLRLTAPTPVQIKHLLHLAPFGHGAWSTMAPIQQR